MITSRFVLPALLAAAALALSGCSASSNGSAGGYGGSAGDLRIVATTTQVADLTRNVIGDAPGVTLTQLIQPNQSAHSYDPSAADLTALGATGAHLGGSPKLRAIIRVVLGGAAALVVTFLIGSLLGTSGVV